MNKGDTNMNKGDTNMNKGDTNMNKGRVVINYSICDNSNECNGISECPTGSLYWNQEKEKIDFNNKNCIDCGLCAKACPVGAILFGANDEEHENNKEEVKNDTRTLAELNVERYGAEPIGKTTEIKEVKQFVEDNEIVLLELFNYDTINCKLFSIKVNDIKRVIHENFQLDDFPYVKHEISEGSEFKTIKIEQFPSLVVYKNQKIKGIISGYYDNMQRDEFFKSILEILK